jgi:hypothetical protein
MSDVYCRKTGIWNAISIGIRSAHTLLQLEYKVRGLANRKHWNPGRQTSHTGGFLLVVAMEALYYWSNVS